MKKAILCELKHFFKWETHYDSVVVEGAPCSYCRTCDRYPRGWVPAILLYGLLFFVIWQCAGKPTHT